MGDASGSAAPEVEGARESDRVRRRLRVSDPRIGRWITFGVAVAIPGWLVWEGGGAGPIERHQAALVLWLGLAIAFMFGVLPRARGQRGLRMLAIAVGALAGWIALALLWTGSVERSIAELARLGGYVGLGLLVLAAVTNRTWRHAAGGLAAVVGIVCLIAFASRLTTELIDWGLRPAIGGERLNYPFEYWNVLAFWATSATLLLIAWGTWGRDRLLRAVALAGAPIAGAVLYMTYSRGGLVALAAGVVTLIALAPARERLLEAVAVALAGAVVTVVAIRTQPQIADGSGSEGAVIVLVVAFAVAGAAAWVGARPRRTPASSTRLALGRPRRMRIAAATVVIAAGLALAAGIEAPAEPERTARPLSLARPDDPASRLLEAGSPRWQLWAAALEGARDSPIGGHGAGTFTFVWERSGRGGERVSDAHSLYLGALVELGLPGTVALLALLAGIAVLALRARAAFESNGERGLLAALIAVYAAFLLHTGIDWLWQTPAAGALGLGAGLLAIASRSRPRPARMRRGGRPLAIAAIAIGLGLLQVPGLVSADRLAQGRIALAHGQSELAAELADEALTAAPFSAAARAHRAEAELARGEYDRARDDALEAARLEPDSWRHAMLRARVELAAGRPEAALEALDEVTAIVPRAEPLVRGLKRAVRRGEDDALAGFARY